MREGREAGAGRRERRTVVLGPAPEAHAFVTDEQSFAIQQGETLEHNHKHTNPTQKAPTETTHQTQ